MSPKKATPARIPTDLLPGGSVRITEAERALARTDPEAFHDVIRGRRADAKERQKAAKAAARKAKK